MTRQPSAFRFAVAARRALLLLMALVVLPHAGLAQSVNDGYDPGVNANGAVYALAVRPNGKTIVGGAFTQIAGATRNHLARLNPDGSLDTDFATTDVDGVVLAIAVQADGRILIGGSFNHVGIATRHNIARLNADGSVDGTFDPYANSNVRALAVQANGMIVIGGDFIGLAPNGGAAITRYYVARLYPSGYVDMSFNPNPSGTVTALAVQADGKVAIAGGFLSLAPNGGTSELRYRIARLNVDGSLDAAYDPHADAGVNALVLQADGKLIVGGDFTSIGGAALRLRLARLNEDGTCDTTFSAVTNDGSVSVLARQADGRILVGGSFTFVSSISRNHIARVNPDGNVDATFNPNAGDVVRALAVQPDGKLVVGGAFSMMGTTTRHYMARLYADGSVDATLDPGITRDEGDPVTALVSQPGGKLVVGGDFTTIGGQPRNHIARLNGDGSVDAGFDPDANLIVYAMVLLPDGKLVVGGNFTTMGGQPRNHIARLNADGSVDAAFSPDANDYIAAVALQPDGKLVVGGAFTSIDGQLRNYIARLNADGSVDAAFNPDANNFIAGFALQPDGKLVVGGAFTSIDGQLRNYIARLNADGTVDSAFDPNLNDRPYALALQPDGKLVVGGYFTVINAQSRNYIARLNADGSVDAAFDPNANGAVATLALQLDGKLVVGGLFTGIDEASRDYLVRLNADGTLDAAFNPNANGVAVTALALQADGKLIVGGVFTTIGGQSRNNIARFSTPQAALPALDLVRNVDGSSVVTWTRTGSGPELALPAQLLFSTDGNAYASVGTMQRFGNGWRATDFVPPLASSFYLRARGEVSTGEGNRSVGAIESTRQFFIAPIDYIFANGFDTIGGAWNFDDATAPALPAEFATATSGSGVPWIAVTGVSDSAPNATFSPENNTAGDASLTTPAFRADANTALSFALRFNTEAGFDGVRLEIAYDGGAFQEFNQAGGAFIAGGYNSALHAYSGCVATPNPLADGPAWTGSQPTFVRVTGTLPQMAAGHDVQLRWRIG